MAATDPFSEIRAWDAASGEEVLSATAHIHPVSQRTGIQGARFLPGSKMLATVGTDGCIRYWDIPNKKALPPVSCGIGDIESFDFSPDGKLVAVGSDQAVILLDQATSKEIALIEGIAKGREGLSCLRFTPDGQWLVAAAGDIRKGLVAWSVPKLLASARR